MCVVNSHLYIKKLGGVGPGGGEDGAGFISANAAQCGEALKCDM